MLMGLCREHSAIETDIVEPNHLYQLMVKTHYVPDRYEGIGVPAGIAERIFYKAIRHFTISYYKSLCERTQKSMAVLKHPYLSPHIFRLSRVFPNAKFIHLVRHPYDTMASTVDFVRKVEAAAKLLGTDLEGLLTKYEKFLLPIIETTPMLLNERRFMFAKFEDLLEDPVDVLQEVFQFLGRDPGIPAIEAIVQKANDNKLSLVGTALGSSIIRTPKRKFDEVFNRQQQDKVKARLKPFVKEFGYEEY